MSKKVYNVCNFSEEESSCDNEYSSSDELNFSEDSISSDDEHIRCLLYKL